MGLRLLQFVSVFLLTVSCAHQADGDLGEGESVSKVEQASESTSELGAEDPLLVQSTDSVASTEPFIEAKTVSQDELPEVRHQKRVRHFAEKKAVATATANVAKPVLASTTATPSRAPSTETPPQVASPTLPRAAAASIENPSMQTSRFYLYWIIPLALGTPLATGAVVIWRRRRAEMLDANPERLKKVA